MSEVSAFMSWLDKFKEQSTDEKSVVDFFSDVKTHKQLCMPAVVEIINTERFALSGNVNTKFSYFGRHDFARLVIDFKDMLNKNKSVLRALVRVRATCLRRLPFTCTTCA
jgi:hypothetical protein